MACNCVTYSSSVITLAFVIILVLFFVDGTVKISWRRSGIKPAASKGFAGEVLDEPQESDEPRVGQGVEGDGINMPLEDGEVVVEGEEVEGDEVEGVGDVPLSVGIRWDLMPCYRCRVDPRTSGPRSSEHSDHPISHYLVIIVFCR